MSEGIEKQNHTLENRSTPEHDDDFAKKFAENALPQL